jgi:hypothetical protein
MINRNFKTVMLGWIMSSQVTNNSVPRFQSQTIYNVGGGGGEYPPVTAGSFDVEAMSKCIINALNQVTTNNIIARQSVNRLFIAVGTGTTEATEEDYTLETENTDIICETITQTYTQAYKRQITATFNNPTSQDITLKEAGLFYETYLNDQYYINTIMLARENINVTIPAGESKAITMEIG